ncbi:MAG: SGNH/GDSL hydrolase family protein, partial [archaeon]
MRILVFGDSISFGAADPNGGWVQKLGKFLYGKTTKGNDDYQVYNLGISADSSIEILKRFESETIARERGPERTMIIFAFGTNDAQSFSNGSLRTSTEEFGSNVRKLIELAR